MKQFFLITAAFFMTISCCRVAPTETTATKVKSTLDVIHSRKSVRSYSDAKVSQEQLDTLVRAAMAAPSGMDRRPWEFIIVTDKEVMTRWADTLPYAAMLKRAQAAIVVCGRSDETKGGSPYWYIDCAAASQNILLAAESMGLGAVWTATYPYDDRMDVVNKEYNLPEDVKPLCIIPIGYPEGKQEPKDKYDPTRLHKDTYNVK